VLSGWSVVKTAVLILFERNVWTRRLCMLQILSNRIDRVPVYSSMSVRSKDGEVDNRSPLNDAS
jgi:hypothetical protein